MKEEVRLVKMVLSNISVSISSPFSSDIVTSVEFHYIQAPPYNNETATKKMKQITRNDKEEKLAFGTYAGGTEKGSQYTVGFGKDIC